MRENVFECGLSYLSVCYNYHGLNAPLAVFGVLVECLLLCPERTFLTSREAQLNVLIG